MTGETPVMETLRGLLFGTPIGNSAILCRRMVGSYRPGQLPVGQEALQPRPRPADPLRCGQRPGSAASARSALVDPVQQAPLDQRSRPRLQ
jgi:hypothetical protein